MSRTSGTADAAVGMMDAAYFTGRKELLEFFNDLLDLNLTKIEQTASGAIACQLTELIFPRSIPMSKVNWEAKSDYEFIQNYKLLQAAFTKNRVQRHVDVDKLIRAKYQDNLEFCQWLKAFYDQSGVYREDYDPMAVRARGKGGKKYNDLLTKGSAKPGRPRPVGGGTAVSKSKPTTAPPPAAADGRPSRPLRERSQKNEAATTEAVVADAALMKKNADLTAKVEELETKSMELEQAVLDIEKERDFYFEKLRNVEVLLQVHQEKGTESDPDQLVEKIFKLLYAVAEDNIIVNDEGEVVEASELLDDAVDGVALEGAEGDELAEAM